MARFPGTVVAYEALHVRLDGCDGHQVLHGIGELPVECDQSVCFELGAHAGAFPPMMLAMHHMTPGRPTTIRR
jgi:hypothetical protein